MPHLPTHAQLPPGTPVNIVLKADQRGGKLTQGVVAETLTKGDHPRGVKVSLADGRVGRVQSFAHSGGGVGGGAGVATGLGGNGDGSEVVGGGNVSGFGGGQSLGTGMRGGKIQDDYRNDPVPVEERSLEDFIKAPSRNQRKKGRKGGGAALFASGAGQGGGEGEVSRDGDEDGGGGKEKTVQEVLEGEFSELDPALIAAIVADYGEVEGARAVLKGLG